MLIGYLLVWMAAVLWASLGPLYKLLLDQGMPPLMIVALRTIGAAIILIGWTVARERSLAGLRIARRDVPLMLAYGIIGITFFYAAYAYAIQLTGVAVAVVLMYTAPVWVALIAWRLGEGIGIRQVIALIAALLGCALVAEAYDPAALRLNAVGVLWGLGAGLGYGLYSIFNKIAVSRYAPLTVQFYGFAIGGILLMGLQASKGPSVALRSPLLSGAVALLMVACTLGGGLTYAMSVQRIPVSIASLLATLEPALATLFGYVFFGERLRLGQWVGAGMILAVAILLRPREEARELTMPATR
ncbi:MAG TPA: EamA family transporter [Caldilineae bacterium]|nr:EamA family transporter [Caldilineae bacterium]